MCEPDAKGKVAICHATSSAKNPYVLIRPDLDGCINGHSDHEGDRDADPVHGCDFPECSGLGGGCETQSDCCGGLTCHPVEPDGYCGMIE